MARASAKSASQPSELTAKARFVVLTGKDRFLQDQYIRTLRESLTKALGEGGFDTVRFDGQQGPRILADVMDECRSFGLMQQHKIVLIDNAELLLKTEDDDAAAAPKATGKKGASRAPAPLTPREILESYAESPSDSATLVLRAGTWRPGNLDKKLNALPEAVGGVIKCEPPTFQEATAWAVRRCKARHNSSIDNEAARTLVETTGIDLGRIDTELEKLALAAGGDGSPITIDLVESMVGRTRQEEFFAIQSSLLSGDAGRAIGKLRELVDISRQDPVPIAWAYIEAARKLHIVARSGGRNVWSLQGQLKAFGPDSGEILSHLERLSKTVKPVAAARLLKAAVQTDAGNKSGLGDPVRNLEVLAMKFAAAGSEH